MTDSYSFTGDRPWINHEWLAECVMYGAYAVGHGTGLVALKIVLLVAMVLAIERTFRLARIPRHGRDLLTGLVLLATSSQAMDVRPQLFSLALFAWLLTLLLEYREGRTRLIWLAIPMTAIWANLHGGWIVGAGALAAWAGAWLVTKTPWRDKLVMGAIAAAAATATIVNPYGWHLWEFLRQTVSLSRADILEWLPIYLVFQKAPLVTVVWIVVAVSAIVAFRSARSTSSFDVRAFAIVSGLGVASFRVNRLLAFFAIALVMLMAAPLASAIELARPGRRLEPIASRASAVLGAVALIVLVGSITLSSMNSRCIVVDPETAPEPNVVPLIQQRGLHGRMITWFNWGEYTIWHLAPRMTVSMDGRRETVYSDATLDEHVLLYLHPEQRHQVLERLEPDYIWLPSGLEVVHELQTDGWTPIFSGSQSVLLGRDAAGPSIRVTTLPRPRCFPGP
jgi:hypothetical protein